MNRKSATGFASHTVRNKTLAAVVAAVVLAGFAAGCSGGNGPPVASTSGQPLATTSDFDRQVLQARGPVLVEFYTSNCPSCVAQEGALQQLAREYQGQVIVTKFWIGDSTFSRKTQKVKDRYEVKVTPTMILFVDGHEKQRWTGNHSAQVFRPALNATKRR